MNVLKFIGKVILAIIVFHILMMTALYFWAFYG